MINLFTQTDLDGIACSILCHMLAKQQGSMISERYSGREDATLMDAQVSELLSYLSYAREAGAPLPLNRLIVIAGGSLRPKTMEALKALTDLDPNRTRLLFIHRNQPVQDAEGETPPCMATTLYRALQTPDTIPEARLLSNWATDVFVEDVRRFCAGEYDPQDNPNHLHYLLQAIGEEPFRQSVQESLVNRIPYIVQYTPFAEVVMRMVDRDEATITAMVNNRTVIRWRGHPIAVTVSSPSDTHLAARVIQACPDVEALLVLDEISSGIFLPACKEIGWKVTFIDELLAETTPQANGIRIRTRDGVLLKYLAEMLEETRLGKEKELELRHATVDAEGAHLLRHGARPGAGAVPRCDLGSRRGHRLLRRTGRLRKNDHRRSHLGHDGRLPPL